MNFRNHGPLHLERYKTYFDLDPTFQSSRAAPSVCFEETAMLHYPLELPNSESDEY